VRMRSLSLLVLLAAAVYAQEITDDGIAIPEYDPMPTDNEPVETTNEDNWEPEDRELENVDPEPLDGNAHGGRPEVAFYGHGHRHGHHGYHLGHRGYPFHGFHRGAPCRRHFRHKVIVSDRHHVIAHPRKPCKKVVKHVTVHTHAPRRHHHHHHHHDSSSSEEVPCGCRAHRHGHHHGHHGHHGHGYGHGYGHGHGHGYGHGHGFGHGHGHGYGSGFPLAPFL
ncbi:hypothetical protein PENTCL1PPCAC_28762, partial [Pristionchus entomophagus]